MNLFQLFRHLRPFVKPYKWLVAITLILTLVGSLMAQVNAIVLDRTVDAINALIGTDFQWARAARIMTIITIVLLSKEILSALITFAQNYFGERMRIFVSRDLAQSVIEKVMTFRMAFFNAGENATGKLQARIDQGVSSLSRTVQNFFIDLLPLFTSALLALVLMFAANVWVGLVALSIVPVYFWITIRQARRLKGWRREMRGHIGLVLQKNQICDGTIEENIRYGKPDATHEEVVEAARKSYLLDQVMALPKQFENKASDLSGGQQQRIAIARMFLKNPPIIFLDEPTASLDAVATEQIKNSLDAIKQGRTVIIISHSISQIIDSDMVYALQKGRVEESGDPEGIYRKGGIYKEIIDASARSLNIGKIARTIEEGKE